MCKVDSSKLIHQLIKIGYINEGTSSLNNKRILALDFAWYNMGNGVITEDTPKQPAEVLKALVFAANKEIESYETSKIK